MDTSLRRQAERILKGAANHRRIQILLLIKEKRCLSLFAIQDLTAASRQAVCEHTRRLALAGLIRKRYRGREVHHTLAPLGHRVLSFLPALLSR